MNHDDRVFLNRLNESSKQSPNRTCSEDQFELVMEFFEETSSLKQPYATVDNAPVLPFLEMEASFDETVDETARLFAQDIYEHWKERRLATENHPLMPSLKFERNVDTDDADPYVCFRRREVRQARKTRGRDAQIVEKLKRLRIELEHARELMHLTKQRELARKEQLALDRQIFEQRVAVKETRRNLNVPGDDFDILINQKPVERVPKADPRLPGVVPKPPRLDGRAPDSDMHQLIDDRVKREAEVNAIIQESMGKHRAWNAGMVDHTWRPITPPLEQGFKPSFRAAVTEYLPSPPNSASGDDPPERSPFRYVSPPPDAGHMSFRRRVGRGGRLWMDRRGPSRNSALYKSTLGGGPGPLALADAAALREQMERFEYDVDSDDDSDEVHINDPYDNLNIRYRIIFTVPPAPRGDQAAMQQQRMVEDALKRSVAGQARGMVQQKVAAK
jgi:enhancer of polycomb-like protein